MQRNICVVLSMNSTTTLHIITDGHKQLIEADNSRPNYYSHEMPLL